MQIKSLRAEYGLTQQELSAITGIPRRTIENWESGVRHPPEWLPKMIQAFLDAAGPF